MLVVKPPDDSNNQAFCVTPAIHFPAVAQDTREQKQAICPVSCLNSWHIEYGQNKMVAVLCPCVLAWLVIQPRDEKNRV